MKKVSGICMAVILCLFCGCAHAQSIEKQKYVLALGVTKINKKYLVRFSYADFDKGAVKTGTRVPSASVTYLSGSWREACLCFKKSERKPIQFGHLKVIIFQGSEPDQQFIRQLKSDQQISNSVFVISTKNKIRKIFSKEKNLPISLGEYLEQRIENSHSKREQKKLTLGLYDRY